MSEIVRGGATRLAAASLAISAALGLPAAVGGAETLSAENNAAFGRAAIIALLAQEPTIALALSKHASWVPPLCLHAI
jgi:hypothetical protein